MTAGGSDEPMCRDYPDVRVSDVEALEFALLKVLDHDEACDAAVAVVAAGWRPARAAGCGGGNK